MEDAVTNQGKQDAPVKASFLSLFKFAGPLDYFLMFTGTLGAVCMGIYQPVFFLFMANFLNGMGDEATHDDFYNKSITVTYFMIIFGSVFMICGWIAVMSWVIIGARQGSHFRKKYFKAILNVDSEYLDKRAIAEIPTSITTDTLKIERAAGDKLVIIIFTASMILSSFIMGIIIGTQLAFVTLCFGPLIVFGLILLNNGTEQSAKAADTSYRKAGGIAEEALQEIKTVASLNGQKHETRKYVKSLHESQSSMMITGLKTGTGIGLAMLGFFIMLGSCYMVGAKFMDIRIYNWADNKPYDIGKVIVVMFIGILAFNNMGTMLPGIRIITDGQFAAGRIFKLLSEKSKLTHGTLKPEILGAVVFDDVRFSYPTAKSTPVLKGLNFSLNPGERLGIVGSTGTGKSTVVQLLLRYYEQDSGLITIDGNDIKSLDIKYLRSNISVVSQEPILFNTTIYENINYGRILSSKEDIEKAALLSGAMDFIKKLPDGFETNCGSKGSHLSGGQKQRIAIARAIVRKPKILLLDEATSALDRRTEKEVVDSLEISFPDCTWITIAQNLLTVKKSNKIIMIEKGEVVEKGSHKRLMKKEGRYYHLFKMQELQMSNEDQEQVNNKISDSIEKDENPVDEEEQKKLKSLAFKKMMLLGKSEKLWLLLGCTGSIVVGFFYPLTGMLSGLEISVLGKPNNPDLMKDSIRYGYLIIIFGVIVFFGMMLEAISYPRMGANITKKIREMSFKAMISYESAFYDQPENNCSALSARLSNDCEKVNGLGGSLLGIILGLISSLVVAHAAAAFFSWRMSLIVLSIVPIIIFSISANFMAQMQGVVKFNYENLTSVAADSITHYRTTKAFNLEKEMQRKYMAPVRAEAKATNKKAVSSGFTYGLGFGLIFYAYALLFWYGAKLVRDQTNTFEDMVTAMIAAIVGSDAFFTAGVYAPDMKNGIEAGKRLFKILEYVPSINVNAKDGIKKEIEGKIEFSNVDFSYPNRAYLACKNVSFELKPGMSLGIIGRTGSGKSTIMQLILRQYDVKNGKVKIDGENIINYNIKHLRSQISVVSQEPVLFSGSIKENIAYGVKATDEEIEDAARKAQAYEFVTSHEDGFNREVGIKGCRLSGGQKQRIAIARAIIRKPKILLMDEATSALDANTESEVLKNIRGLMSEATCVTVAHRLKTIDNCDYIIVMESGKIMEQGEREKLKAQGGYYSNMVAET
ncbi:hypothetical protein SteCoe_18035 [Stentor coeruleus]|uniref:Bile salt export pump n=1 Tax=Stentor coeruleus TaxID=5963 RepID=A0A1R2BXN3_9CILI|nr:hypothetical protein SteCoe_18035 [Stentor coeruleus]